MLRPKSKGGNRRASSSKPPASKKVKDIPPVASAPPVVNGSQQPPRPTPSPFPVIAQVGMRGECMLDNWGPHFFTIIHVCPDACVVLLDENRYGGHPRDGEDAEFVAALAWEKVLISGIQPPRPSKGPVPCIVKPGMRARVSTNDGNDDMDGTVIWAHPECVVVELDGRTKNDDGKFAACEWDRVTMLNMSPEDGRQIARAS
jgi:hypothetical protein